jgi:hypothetical protein
MLKVERDSQGFLRLAAATIVLVLIAVSFADDTETGLRTELLMAGTPYETELYVLESGEAGPNVLVLAGVHGNEPGSWLAADALLREGPPEQGQLLLVPRANKLAVQQEVRSTPELGDLNRLYFAEPELFPMARMAAQIVEVAARYDVDVVLDMHESWDFYEQTSSEVELSALGQTISPHRSEPSVRLTRELVEEANRGLPASERFLYHEFPEGHVDELIVPLPPGVDEREVPRKSGMDIPEALPGVASILVEVGQQQPMERRVAQQVIVARALVAVLAGD